MAQIDLRYGRGAVPFEYDDSRFEILGSDDASMPLSDIQIGQKLDEPLDSPPLEELVRPGQTVLVAVPDATRQTASGEIVNLLVRRLIANGTAAGDIRIIFATGIHRKVTAEEKAAILTPFIAQRIRTIDHEPRDLAGLVRIGRTSTGIPVEVNRAVVEHDHVILVGGVTFHYFAGFTGGRKLICPGLASSRTISETHKLAFDCSNKTRRSGVDTGLLDGNAVHEAFVEAVSLVDPAFAVNTIVNDAGHCIDLVCGEWQSSHRRACDLFSAGHSIEIKEKRPLVIAACGGSPSDIKIIQAHKALDSAARACTDGGVIWLLAECSEGLGRRDFLEWFDARDSFALAEMLCERYQVNGQTAWALLQKAERFEIRIVTDLDTAITAKMRLKKTFLDKTGPGQTDEPGYILPSGAKFLVSLS
jgi:nickel-dependent lactate racemase